MWNPVCEDIKIYKEPQPITPMEALNILMDTINGKKHSWQDVKRANEILRKVISNKEE